MFGKRRGRSLRSLSEEDIRNRLYGSAVGVASELAEETPRKQKTREAALPQQTVLGTEPAKIQNDIDSLKKELEQTRRKLEKIKGLKTRKIRALLIYLAISFVALLFAVIVIRHFFFGTGSVTPPPPAAAIHNPTMKYTIQVATYHKRDDAHKFASGLSTKGYKAFIRRSVSRSRRERFIVYVGSFKDKEATSKTLTGLKTKEGIGDSFIANMPK
ncbi:MAG: SPOR domain-containing protein [Candidatus Omnitrophica bacterium]|nr:SPOR domain-containing protein [Candidatus Omnitrophota bacterium]